MKKLLISIILLISTMAPAPAQSLPWVVVSIRGMFTAIKADREGNVLMFACNEKDQNKMAVLFRPVIPLKGAGQITAFLETDNNPLPTWETWEVSDGNMFIKDPLKAAEILEAISETTIFKITLGNLPTKIFDNIGIDTVLKAVTKACGR